MDDVEQTKLHLPDPGDGNLMIVMRYGSRELGSILSKENINNDEALLVVTQRIRLLVTAEIDLKVSP